MVRITKKQLEQENERLKKRIAELEQQLSFYLNIQAGAVSACGDISKFIFDLSRGWNLK